MPASCSCRNGLWLSPMGLSAFAHSYDTVRLTVSGFCRQCSGIYHYHRIARQSVKFFFPVHCLLVHPSSTLLSPFFILPLSYVVSCISDKSGERSGGRQHVANIKSDNRFGLKRGRWSDGSSDEEERRVCMSGNGAVPEV